ncbi:MAG: hypothetical protein IPK52_00390 [Chloroflexi bacterium]|nr:hypothetical protein [Chloroflexota bacterium]
MLGKLKVTGTVGRITPVSVSKKSNPYIYLSVCYEDKTDTEAAKWMRVAVVGDKDIATVKKDVVKGALVEVNGTPYADTYAEGKPMLCVIMNSIKVKALPKPKAAEDVMPSIPTPAELEAAVQPEVKPAPTWRKAKTKPAIDLSAAPEPAPIIFEGATPI